MRTIYNTSYIIDAEIENEWIEFMRMHYLPVLHQHCLCDDLLFTRVSIDQPEGKTYSLQIVFHSEEQQQHFLDAWLPDLEQRLMSRYVGRYVCFSSILTEI